MKLDELDWNISKTAQVLGIERTQPAQAAAHAGHRAGK